MNQSHIDKITNAVLYEGYVLYPYRPSVKNRQRWTFGGVYPRIYSEAQAGNDAWSMQTECLVRGSEAPAIQVKVRFLHLMQRFVKKLDRPQSSIDTRAEPTGHMVESLRIGDKHYQTWQEASEREVTPARCDLTALTRENQRTEFHFAGSRQHEPIRDEAGAIVAVLERVQETIVGAVDIAAFRLADDLFRIRVRVENLTPLGLDCRQNRDEALLRSLASTHTILEARGGEFISHFDPPPECRDAIAACRNIGTWPVLVGTPGECDAMLSAPIILYDYPEIAPESPGDLFDATEIDEILSLRILTLTDEEKQSAAAMDQRVRALLQRTETLGAEQFAGLHGAVRGLRPVTPGGTP